MYSATKSNYQYNKKPTQQLKNSNKSDKGFYCTREFDSFRKRNKIRKEIEHEKKIFLAELKEDDDDYQLNEESLNASEKFFEKFILENNLTFPNIDVFPSGEVSFTWHSKPLGIINILFTKDKKIKYLSNLGKNDIKTHALFDHLEQIPSNMLAGLYKF